MTQELHCAGCGKPMATLRDARVRNGMVVYCAECNAAMQRLVRMATAASDPMRGAPDFMRDLFRGFRR